MMQSVIQMFVSRFALIHSEMLELELVGSSRLRAKPSITRRLLERLTPAMRVRQKFSTIRPATLGQAGRISGITPADIALLTIHLQNA